jgi:glycosyltransferase involved in cell wall biosynthesis
MGLRLVVCHADRWHDYSEADCVIAVRGFGSSPYLHKPATKLYNAWLAGVPFLGGSDSAYSSEGSDGVNYLACRTKEDFVQNLKRLKADPGFRQRLVEAGTREAMRHTPEAHTKRWISLLRDVAPERWKSWQKKSAGSRRLGIFWRSLWLMVDRWRMN